MQHVLVPLDGSDLAASIIPEAIRVAGPDGELILIRDASTPRYESSTGEVSGSYAVEVSEAYLETTASSLSAQGVRVRAETFVMGNAVSAIDEAAQMYAVDMIACATHGRSGIRRLIQGSVAWEALPHSHVPVLLRRPAEIEPGAQRAVDSAVSPSGVLVPLDGSLLAESALPIAQRLAKQWKTPIWLVRVVPDVRTSLAPHGAPHTLNEENEPFVRTAQDYLDDIARSIPNEIHTNVRLGPAVEALVDTAHETEISHIVMASHGRSGLSRVIMGSVADALVHKLNCPIVIVPALVATSPAQKVERAFEKRPVPTFA